MKTNYIKIEKPGQGKFYVNLFEVLEMQSIFINYQ